jgi:diaminohydroxyphosphoribosylaminopyrimidine deaminase/5-amino-6-(5-phosphoribosylamino)uracil reductase
MTDQEYMHRALTLAEQGRWLTSPNPMVGAVIVKNSRVVGEGYHRGPGLDHAEVAALGKAGHRARGATLFVNLEPCCHVGRTGPCTEAIVKAGITMVVAAVKDPNPLVNGKGVGLLRREGVAVEVGLLKREAVLLNDKHFGYYRNGRPYVILKTAQTLDGRIATITGDSKWISSAASLRLAHGLRAEVDAVVVGMGTVREDNPALTVRHVKGANPYRIVLSRSLDFPAKCRLLDDNGDYKSIVATTAPASARFASTKRGRRVILWDLGLNRAGAIDLSDFLRKADEFGLRSLLVEGGSTLATAFLRAGLVDKLVQVIAPVVMGQGIPSVGDLGIKRLSAAIRFDQSHFRASDGDTVFVGYPRRR